MALESLIQTIQSKGLPDPVRVDSSGSNRLVKVDVAVANLDVEPAGWVDADPSLVVHRCALTTVV
jgi:hypothetical protein